MIASVVATLSPDAPPLPAIIEELNSISGVTVGDPAPDSRRLPITIDSSAPRALQKITDQLQTSEGIAFVDVVFVHFEDDLEQTNTSKYGEMA